MAVIYLQEIINITTKRIKFIMSRTVRKNKTKNHRNSFSKYPKNLDYMHANFLVYLNRKGKIEFKYKKNEDIYSVFGEFFCKPKKYRRKTSYRNNNVFYKETQERRLRNRNKQEFYKYLNKDYYEPLFFNQLPHDVRML